MVEFLWCEKYRPSKVKDLILPAGLKSSFQKFVDDKLIPNLILAGSPGVGKTSVARAVLNEIGADFLFVNGSLNGNIDTLRNEIQNFASSLSMTGGRKYVVLDEADYLNPNSTQPALRSFMEEFSVNTGFILTCNFKNRIIDALHSRCSTIDFKITETDAARLASQFTKKVMEILTAEGVEYEVPVVAEVVKKFYPDWRRVINELQRYASQSGRIDSGVLSYLKDDLITDLVVMMRRKDYTGMRKWVSDNSHVEQSVLYRRFYDEASSHFTAATVPAVILVLGKYLYQAAFSADAEINTMCCLTEILIEGKLME